MGPDGLLITMAHILMGKYYPSGKNAIISCNNIAFENSGIHFGSTEIINQKLFSFLQNERRNRTLIYNITKRRS